MKPTRQFLFTLLVSFFMAFLAQKLIYTINIWFNFVPGSFFWTRSSIKLYYFRSLCENMTLNKHVFQDRNWCSTKSDRWFFFLTLAVRWHFYGKHFKWKKYGGAGLLSEKTEAATGSYSTDVDLLQYIYSTLVAKNH